MDKEREEALRLCLECGFEPAHDFTMGHVDVDDIIALIRLSRQSAPQGEPMANDYQNLKAKEQVLFDIHHALGVEWGDNVYLAIDRLKSAAPPAQPSMLQILQGSQKVFRSIFEANPSELAGADFKEWARGLAFHAAAVIDAALNHQSPLKNEAD